MAVAFVNSATAVGATSVTEPTGVTSSHHGLVLAVAYDSLTATFTPPAGYSSTPSGRLLVNTGAFVTVAQVFVGAAAGAGTGHAFTNSAGAAQDLAMLVYSGCDPAAPVDVDSGVTHAGSTSAYTATWTGVTAARASSMAITFFGGYNVDGPAPAGFTVRISALDGVTDAYEKVVNAGDSVTASGAVAGDSNSINFAALFLVVLQPPAASTPSNVLATATDRINRNTLLRM